MRKMENLNNMKKTVLKLEKEIMAISNNLSKVKNKDHTTMKKIIYNINNLLGKDLQSNNLYKNDYMNNLSDKKLNKQIEEKKEMLKKQYIQSNERQDKNIEYIIMPTNQQQKKNEIIQNDIQLSQHYNKKSVSSSKIYNNINNNNIMSEGKNESYTKKYFGEYNNLNYENNENKINSNRNNNINNNIIDYSNNKVINKTNQIAYTKPRLLSENSVRNLKNKNITNIASKNNSITNLINKNKNNNTSIKNDRIENDQISNLKYLTLNQKINHDNIEIKYKNQDIINNLYTKGNKYFYNENQNENENKNYYTFEKKDINMNINDINEKNRDYSEKENKQPNKKEEYKQESDLEQDILMSNIKNKKISYERKPKRNKTVNLNSNSNIRSPLNLNNYNINSTHHREYEIHNSKNNLNKNKNKKHTYLNLDLNNEDLNKVGLSQKNIKTKNNYKYSYENLNIKDNEDIYPEDLMQNKNDNNNNNKEKFENTDKSEEDVKNSKEKDIINKLLYMLKVKNINDVIYKVDKLLKYEKYIIKLNELYNENNKSKFNKYNNFNNRNEKIDLEKNIAWISNTIKKSKKNEKYRNYCKNIMMKNKINHFSEFRNFIDNILIKNRKNKGFIIEVKNILCEDDYYSKNQKNNKDPKKINNINYISSKNMKTDVNKGQNNFDNSNDIKFSQNDDNAKVNKYMNTYY